MKTSFRILFVALVILALPVTAMAQKTPTNVPKYELSFGGGAGISGYMPIFSTAPWTKGASDAFSYYTKPSWIPGIGGHAGLYLDVNFTDNWGLITGAEFGAYTSQIRSSGLLTSANYDCGFEYIIATPPLYPQTKGMGTEGYNIVGKGWFVTRLDNFKETHKMYAVQIPIMAKYMKPLSGGVGGHNFYVAAGVKLGIHVTPDVWSQSWDEAIYNSFFTGSIKGYNKERLTREPTTHFMYNTTDRKTIYEDTKRDSGILENTNINRVDVMLSLDTGFRWKLSSTVGLYTGIYFDLGLIRPIKAVDGKVLNISEFFFEDTLRDFRDYNDGKWYSDPVARWEGTTYHSILEAQGPDYYNYKETASQNGSQTVSVLKADFYPDEKPYARVLSNMQAGIKVRVSFALTKPEKKVKQPKEPKQPKPKPEKVPPKIQRTMMELSNTLFAFDKFDLNEKAQKMLDEVADWLKENPDLNVEIGGHTDSMGSDSYNQKLSENRAKAVYDYFVSHGVSASRLSYKGYGESRPIATNETDEGRQLNRRVELQIQE